MGSVRMATLSLAAVLGSILVIGDASAKPVDRPASVTIDGKDVRWVCGPYTCWQRPGPYWSGPYWDDEWGWLRHRRPYFDPHYYRWDFGGDWW